MKVTETERIAASSEPRIRVWRLALAALLTTLLAGADYALACPVCFGDPDSEMAQGAMWGIMVLGLFIGSVLMGIVGVGATWFIRARRHVD